jgi:hypothetical protein
LRTEHCWLSTYGKAFGFHDNDLYACGERESVTYVLLDCPELRVLQLELRGKVGEAFYSMSTLLGGPGEEGKGKINSTSRSLRKWDTASLHIEIYIVVESCISFVNLVYPIG